MKKKNDRKLLSDPFRLHADGSVVRKGKLHYLKRISRKYRESMKIHEQPESPALTIEDYEAFGIRTFKDLNKYLHKKGEYGGYVRIPGIKREVLLPFHHDFMNDWLKFENPYVERIYEILYRQNRDMYPDRHTFQMRFFEIEERILRNCWHMPVIDRRMLESPVTGCWDEMEITARYLQLKGCAVRRFCFHDGVIMRGHTFIAYYDGVFWNACLIYPVVIRSRDYDRMCRKVFRLMRLVPLYKNKSNCEMIEFDTPVAGMNTTEYLELIAAGRKMH